MEIAWVPSASHGRRASTRIHTANDHPETSAGATRAGVARGQGRRSGAVEGLACQEGPERGRTVMAHRRGRDVAHVPSGMAEPPDEVDVLAPAQSGVEEVGPVGHLRGARPAWRSGRRGPGRRGRTRLGPSTPVQRRPGRLVSGQGAARLGARGDDSGGDGSRPAGRRSGPAAARAIRRRVRSRSPRRRPGGVCTVASPALRAADGPQVVGQSDEPAPRGACATSEVASACMRCVVDHHAGEPFERPEQPVQLVRAVADRHHHGDVVRSEAGRRRSW